MHSTLDRLEKMVVGNWSLNATDALEIDFRKQKCIWNRIEKRFRPEKKLYLQSLIGLFCSEYQMTFSIISWHAIADTISSDGDRTENARDFIVIDDVSYEIWEICNWELGCPESRCKKANHFLFLYK